MMRRPAGLLALCVVFVACTQALAAEMPQRWVSAGGALSEWISELGGEPRLVGVDTTSQHPASLKALPSVGYQRQLSAEGILSLRPDVLVGTEEMGPPSVLVQVRKAGVRVELFSSQADLATVDENLRHLGPCWALRRKPHSWRRAITSNSKRCNCRSRRLSKITRHLVCCCWLGMLAPSR